MAKPKLKMIIAFMLLSVMFLQTTANSNSIYSYFENSSNSNIPMNKLQEAGKDTDNFKKNSYNKPASQNKVAASNESYNKTFNDNTNIMLNSSSVEPGGALNFLVNSSAWSNYDYSNSYSFVIESPDGEYPVNQSTQLDLNNNSGVSNSIVFYSWKNQTLNGEYTHNSTSTGINDDLFGKTINSIINLSMSTTSEQISWQSNGNVTSIVKYGTTNDSLTIEEKIDTYTNDHTVYLTNLNPNTTYYYQVFGDDIFTNRINGSILQFMTPLSPAGFPIIGNIVIESISNTNAIVTIETDINSNATLIYSNNSDNLKTFGIGGQGIESPVLNTTTHSFTFFSLDPGTEYYFYVRANSSNNLSYDNGSILYSFVTDTLGIASVSNFVYNYTFNETHIEFNFTSNLNMNSTIYYTNDYYSRNDVSGVTLDWHSNSTTHTFYLKVEPGTRYFFKIGLKNSTDTYWLINSLVSQYYTFKMDAPEEVNEALIDLTLQLPKYPAVLGEWEFTLTLNQTNNTMVNSPRIKTYLISFIVNTTLIFNFEKLIMKTGETVNETGTFEMWNETDLFNLTSVFSPGDTFGVIGSFSYSSDPTIEINRSEVPYIGRINLTLEGENLNTEQLFVSDLTADPVEFNFTNLGMNNDTMKFLKISIPSVDIYGNISVNVSLTFANDVQQNAYTQIYSYFELNVKYRLGISKSTGESSYQLTESDIVGSVTILPYHWSNLTELFGNENISSLLSISGNDINVSFSVTKDSVPVELFSSDKINYTLYWYRKTLDSSLDTGSYEISLFWHSNTDVERSILVFSDSLYSEQVEFAYSFSLSVLFEVKDLTENIKVTKGETVTLRFKIIVPKTGIAWDLDLTPAISGSTVEYNPLLSEYQIVITAGTDVGVQNKTITIPEGFSGNNKITYNVTDILDNTETIVDTNPAKEIDVSLFDFLLVGSGIIVSVGFIAAVVMFDKKK